MKIAAKILLVLALLAPGVSRLPAQSNSDSMGVYRLGAYDSGGNYLGLLSNSDTFVSFPFTRAPEFRGTVQSVTGNVITVAGTPGWAASQFVYNSASQNKTYYAVLGANSVGAANPKEGCLYTVTANSANTLTLALNGDSIASVPANTLITLIPYWTLSTIFPATDAGVSFTPTTSIRNLQTQVIIPNYAGVGVNLAASTVYIYFSSGTNVGWRVYGGSATVDHGDDPLDPSGYFIVRNSGGAPTLPLLVLGSVAPGKLTTPLAVQSASAQDNALGLSRPVGVTLNNSGLNPTDGSFRVTTTTRSIQDELFLYNNAQVAMNKAPIATYFYMNNGWRLFGDATTTDHGTDTLPPGTALTIRKAPSALGTTFWTNTPGY